MLVLRNFSELFCGQKYPRGFFSTTRLAGDGADPPNDARVWIALVDRPSRCGDGGGAFARVFRRARIFDGALEFVGHCIIPAIVHWGNSTCEFWECRARRCTTPRVEGFRRLLCVFLCRACPIALVDRPSRCGDGGGAFARVFRRAHLRRRAGVFWALHHPSDRSLVQFDVRILGMSCAALHNAALGGFSKITLRVFLPRVSTATWSAGGLGCHKGIHEGGRVERS